jgi:hypothetical protein
MQPVDDVIEVVKLRCTAAGLLRAGENLDCRAHGAERYQADEDEHVEYEDYQDQGWEPKESVVREKEEVRRAIAPFQFCRFGDRIGLHEVQASAEHPEKVFAVTTTISCLTPFDETERESVQFQCAACHDALAAPARGN